MISRISLEAKKNFNSTAPRRRVKNTTCKLGQPNIAAPTYRPLTTLANPLSRSPQYSLSMFRFGLQYMTLHAVRRRPCLQVKLSHSTGRSNSLAARHGYRPLTAQLHLRLGIPSSTNKHHVMDRTPKYQQRSGKYANHLKKSHHLPACVAPPSRPSFSCGIVIFL